MRIGVIGAGGGLGRLIVSALEGQGCEVVVVEPRPGRVAASGGGLAPTPEGRAGGRLTELFSTLQAIIFSAPLASPDLHRTAVRTGCHVVDVAVDAEHNRVLLTLDEEAISTGRSVIVMAGLAPGLRGVLASHVLERFSPTATAAIAATAAITATDRQTQPGAGHLRRSFTLQQLLEDPLVRSVVSSDTGDLLARPPPR